MKIKVSGVQGQVAQELKDAANFYGGILLHHRTLPNICLDIKMLSKMQDIGQCVNKQSDKRNPREFVIRIKNDPNGQDPTQILAHEMVHLKQYATGQLRRITKVNHDYTIHNHAEWEGKMWKPNKREDEYWDSPWEVEAFGREIGLYHRWVLMFNASKGVAL